MLICGRCRCRFLDRKVEASLKDDRRELDRQKLVVIPRPKGRGLIEGSGSGNETVEPWNGFLDRKVEASLKQGVRNAHGRDRDAFLDRKVEASLKRQSVLLPAPAAAPDSSTERSRPH